MRGAVWAQVHPPEKARALMRGAQPQVIRFGPAGNSESFYAQGHAATWEAPAWLHAMGLCALEYSFGRGVRISQSSAEQIAEQATQHGMAMSVHMPYYINLATPDPQKQENTLRYFLESLAAAKQLGATRAVFHPGSAAGGDREAALQQACILFERVVLEIEQAGFGDIILCPETMGKVNQLGDLHEVLTLCGMRDTMLPCIDFGHMHSRGLGAIQGKQDYADILDTVEGALGLERARNMHIHFSRIEFTDKGEKRHRTFAETAYGPDFPPLAEVLAERRYTPVVICESKGTMAEDAVTMMQIYERAAMCIDHTSKLH